MLRIRIRVFDPWIRDPGSQTHIFDNFWGKKFYNSLRIGPNFFLQTSKNKINYNFVKFVAKKRYENRFFFTPLFCYCFWIRDPRSRIRDPGWVKIRIRDKHLGSATLLECVFLFVCIYASADNSDGLGLKNKKNIFFYATVKL